MSADTLSVTPLKGIAPYLGGKSKLAPRIVEIINNIPHKTYAEPFVGAGGIFFRRDNKARCEAINDFNKELATLFRVLQNHPQPFVELLTYHLNSRLIFDQLRAQQPEHLTDLQRAVRFYVLQKQTFGGKVGGVFGVDKTAPARYRLEQTKEDVDNFHKRLSRVWIENLDFEKFIHKYDSSETLFYLDPPYYGNEKDYGKELFHRADFERLCECLKQIKGKFILSLNDCSEVRDIFKDFTFEEVELSYTISTGSPTKAKEVIITE